MKMVQKLPLQRKKGTGYSKRRGWISNVVEAAYIRLVCTVLYIVQLSLTHGGTPRIGCAIGRTAGLSYIHY
jgi:hypothetical protein